MNNIDLIQMGLKNLWRRKLRTFLTILGVIIGTSSIVVMLSLGFGMSQAYQNQISSMGSLTTIDIYKSYADFGENRKKVTLSNKAIMNFKKIPHVIAVTPIVESYGLIINGKYVSDTSIKGIDPTCMEDFGFKIKEGRLLQSGDDFSLVFGGRMEENFNDPKAARRGRWVEPKVNLLKDKMTFTFDQSRGMHGMNMGSMDINTQKTQYKEYKIKSVGILEEGDHDTDWSVYAPLEVVQKMIKEKEKAENSRPERGQGSGKEYEHVLVKVDDINHVQDIQKQMKDMGYEAHSLNDWLEETKKTSNIMQAILGGIGAISLLVAAIGITNTMVMSIYERTKEIGIMKVIGASLKDIKRLFLFESAMIGLLGGFVGILCSKFLSLIINKFGANFGDYMGTGGDTKISIIPIWLIFVAMGFSTLIGIVSGYYPAKRAMNLSALEAIRTE